MRRIGEMLNSPVAACSVALGAVLVVREIISRYSRYRCSGAVVMSAEAVGYKAVAFVPCAPVDVAQDELEATVAELRASFAAGASLSYPRRAEALRGLLRFVEENTEAIVAALASDLGRPRFETLSYDVYTVRGEIQHMIASLSSLMAWKAAPMDGTLLTFPAHAFIAPEPLGVALVMGTWNFPFLLTLVPLVGALAAGNVVVLKPCVRAPRSALLLAKLSLYVSRDLLRVVGTHLAARPLDDDETTESARAAAELAYAAETLRVRYDSIFFTGSSRVGCIVAKAAAEHLTPCTLELGGKNPAYVHADCDVERAAQRCVWGRMLNAGQQCIAPDYVLCHASVLAQFEQACARAVATQFGTDADAVKASRDFGRIVSGRETERLASLLEQPGHTLVCGGTVDLNAKYVAPTVVSRVALDSPLMAREIFGPILCVLRVESLHEAVQLINQRPKPLALYVFATDRQARDKIIRETSAGGVCVNGTIFHGAHPHLPFGGVGDSGHGAYHGDATFHTFSHAKPVLVKWTGTLGDANFFVYPPWHTQPYKEALMKTTMAPGYTHARQNNCESY